ncbi:MAG: 16S rRNA (adenine(1518)-N(6)/adenine(1519)-N(6))-dimethyltransferase RsmA [Candidatus Peregrinibacteria bacterium]|nr:16S rRNA (adenine(1518)-N(6)/adenine(1519)-N(6))-dimethyltransferase RsmA [Candidatus Peregrinibacteria bacterium]
MSKLDQLKTTLEAKGLWAKKSLGQNFLIDEKALEQIVEAADLYEGDEVIEVGPGTGLLTELLIQKAKKVTSVELDVDMVDILRRQFALTENLEVIQADILKTKVEEIASEHYKVVANIPYYITSPVVKHFLQAPIRPKLMVVLVQKEVAEKISGKTGRSFFTVETEIFASAEYVATVPADSFYPAPKVDSAILKLTVLHEPRVPAEELDDFLRLVKFGFSQKRKKLANSLGAGLHKEPSEVRELLKVAGIPGDVRAEELEIEDWQRLKAVLG